MSPTRKLVHLAVMHTRNIPAVRHIKVDAHFPIFFSALHVFEHCEGIYTSVLTHRYGLRLPKLQAVP